MSQSPTTRCKFKCNSVTKSTAWGSEPGYLYTAEFSAVTDGSPENKAFFKWTPTGSLKVGTYTEDRFAVGQEYYLDIWPVPAAVAKDHGEGFNGA